MINKKQVIIANKMDLDSSKDNLKLFKEKVKLPVFEISAMMNIGLDEEGNKNEPTTKEIQNDIRGN